MSHSKLFAGAAVMTAMVAASMPADARPRWHPRYDNGWRHHRGGIDAGDLILGAVLAGGIFAAVSAANNNRNRPRVDRAPDPRAIEDEAAEICADAAERMASADDRGAQVRDITGVVPDGPDAWRVEGVLSSGGGRSYRDRSFVCGTTAGRVDYVRFSEQAAWR